MLRTVSPILSVILAFAVFFYFAKPLFAEIEAIQIETNEYREAVEKAAAFNSKVSQLIAKRNSFSSLELERLETFVPQTANEVRALVDLKALAEKHELLFGNITVSDAQGNPRAEEEETNDTISLEDFESVDVTFGVIGTYEQMRAFLEDVERSLVLMEIISFELTVTEGDLQQYEIVARMFVFNPSVE